MGKPVSEEVKNEAWNHAHDGMEELKKDDWNYNIVRNEFKKARELNPDDGLYYYMVQWVEAMHENKGADKSDLDVHKKLNEMYFNLKKEWPKAVDMIVASEEDDDEKGTTAWFVLDYHLEALKAIFSSSLKNKKALEFYEFGDAIESKYGKLPSVMEVAADAWKEAISIQKYAYRLNYEGKDADAYAAKVKKVDPSYVVPAQASGCVSKK